MGHVKWAKCGRVPSCSAASRRSVRYLRAITLAAFILGVFPGRLLADAKSDFEMLFGKEAKKVLATKSTADDAAFAKKLLTAAPQVADSPGVQVLLYEKAYEFAARDPGAYPTALKAIAYLEKAKGEKIGDWQSKKLKVLADAYSQNEGPAKKTAGKLYIDMLLGLAEAKNAKGDLKTALELYRKAFSAAGEVEPSRAKSISARVTKILVVQKHQAEFAGLKTKLAENPTDVKARTELILFCILELDDPKMAASLLAQNVDEKLRKCVPLAVKKVEDLPDNACMELADWYYKASQEASHWGKRVALQRAKRYYERFLALHSKKDVVRFKAEIALRAISKELPESSPSALTEPAGAGGGRLLLRPRTHSGKDPYRGVEGSMQRAIKHLWSQQSQDGTWPSKEGKRYPTGTTALVAYALLASGVNPQEPRMQKTLNWLSENKSTKTYSLGLRCCVWYLANKKTKGKYLGQLKKDASLLYRSHYDGHYHYVSAGKPTRSWCNSNSQYGLLGVWAAAANGGITIPGNYWQAVMKHWTGTQGPGGGWAYIGTPEGDVGRPTMVTAGLASLYICYDYSGLAGRNPGVAFPPIVTGLEWLDKNFTVKSRSWQYYYLYGVKRVGRASGRKFFGDKDWYKLGAKLLLESQKDEGYWRGSYYASRGSTNDTAFAMLFLVHGRRSVLFNKLKHDGDWDRRDRDIAGLTRALDHVFKSEIDWQIVDFDMPMTDWCDGPILYITGTQDPKFTKEQLEKIRMYVQQGGTIFTVVQKGDYRFKGAMQDAYKRLFPEHQLIAAGPTHEVYSNCFSLGKWTDIKILSNGVRPLVIHTDTDLVTGWPSAGVTPLVRNLRVQIAANVAKYATKAETQPRAPTATPSKVPSKSAASRLKLAKGYIKAGMAQKAEVVLKEIISKYPKSEEATEAKSLIKGIGRLEPK